MIGRQNDVRASFPLLLQSQMNVLSDVLHQGPECNPLAFSRLPTSNELNAHTASANCKNFATRCSMTSKLLFQKSGCVRS